MGTAIVEQIVRSIADAKGVDPVDLDVAIQKWVDTDALRLLADHSSDAWRLQFEMPEHTVTITGAGAVLVDGTEERAYS